MQKSLQETKKVWIISDWSQPAKPGGALGRLTSTGSIKFIEPTPPRSVRPGLVASFAADMDGVRFADERIVRRRAAQAIRPFALRLSGLVLSDAIAPAIELQYATVTRYDPKPIAFWAMVWRHTENIDGFDRRGELVLELISANASTKPDVDKAAVTLRAGRFIQKGAEELNTAVVSPANASIFGIPKV